MNRRSFFASLLALPFLGRARPYKNTRVLKAGNFIPARLYDDGLLEFWYKGRLAQGRHYFNLPASAEVTRAFVGRGPVGVQLTPLGRSATMAP